MTQKVFPDLTQFDEEDNTERKGPESLNFFVTKPQKTTSNWGQEGHNQATCLRVSAQDFKK